jgi:hypothetical protein
MGAVYAELLKLKRSLNWVIVVLLPVGMVVSAAANTLVSGKLLADGWHTLWLRAVGVYGLAPLAIGVAILASLVWRAEHRGGNWNALMSSPTASLRIVTAKAAVVTGMAAAMQLVMVAAVQAMGSLVLGLPGTLPAKYIGTSAVIVLACTPLAIMQSALSMLMRSFAAPVALALLGAALSSAALLAAGDLAIISPYALATRATQLGTGVFADTGTITANTMTGILPATILTAIALIAAHTVILDRSDTRT